MKILFLSALSPIPVNSGIRKRMELSLRVLAAKGEITLIAPGEESRLCCIDAYPAAMCRDVIVGPNSQPAQQKSSGWTDRAKRIAGHLCNPQPTCTRSLNASAWLQALRQNPPQNFDLVWVQGLALYGATMKDSRARVVVDLPDAESAKVLRDLRGRAYTLRVALEALDYLKLRLAERTWGTHRHWFIVSSDKDFQRLGRRRKNTWVVRNAVQVPDYIPDQREEDGILAFVGTFAYKPNRDALLYFVKEIFPHLLRSFPSARLHVIGADPPPEIRNLAGDAHIRVFASVPAVEPYLRRASVEVVPLLNGAGTRLKILEAMSLGKPVVSTSLGAEGLEVTHGENILISDHPEQFAAECVRLLTNPEMRRRIGRNGWEFVSHRYRAEHAEADLRRFLDMALDSHHSSPSAVDSGRVAL